MFVFVLSEITLKFVIKVFAGSGHDDNNHFGLTRFIIVDILNRISQLIIRIVIIYVITADDFKITGFFG